MRRTIKLSELAKINPSRPPLSIDGAEEVSFIAMSDVSDSARWMNRQTRPYREVSQGYTYFQEGDVLFAKITPCMENGKGCHAIGVVNGIGFGSTEFHVLRALSNADSRFVFHLTADKKMRLCAEAQMTGSAGQQRVPAEFLESYPVTDFALPEQGRIADILTTIDDAIARTEALIAKHKRVRAGLMQDLLTKGIDENGVIRSEETHRFKDSPLGRIPVEWEVKEIDEIASFVGSGVTPRGGSEVYVSEGVLFIRSQNVRNDGLDLSDVAFIDEATDRRMKRTRVEPNDVLLNITGASIGRCFYFPAELSAANVNQHVCVIRQPDNSFDHAYFLSSVIASYIGQYQISMLNAGGSREGLNYRQVRSLKVPRPTSPELTRIVNCFQSADRQIEIFYSTLRKLQRVKTGLMQDLLTGKVRVDPLLADA